MSNPNTKKARQLRARMTDAERKLWHFLRNRNFKNLKFRRQVPKGPYIMDFFCAEKKFVIEVDGGHHYRKEQLLHDKQRTTYLLKMGYKILRYPDNKVLNNIGSVLQDILNHIDID
jgi:very-short-patch-repair endonuclease